MNKKEKSTLLIDTTGGTAKVCLDDECISWPAQGKAELVLQKIDQLLRRRKLTLNDLNAIKVNRGPGSFTGTRVGVAVANALNWALGKGKPVKPVY